MVSATGAVAVGSVCTAVGAVTSSTETSSPGAGAAGGATGATGAVLVTSSWTRASPAPSTWTRLPGAVAGDGGVDGTFAGGFVALPAPVFAPALPAGGTSTRRGEVSDPGVPAPERLAHSVIWRRTSPAASPRSMPATSALSGRRSTEPARSWLMLLPKACGLLRKIAIIACWPEASPYCRYAIDDSESPLGTV